MLRTAITILLSTGLLLPACSNENTSPDVPKNNGNDRSTDGETDTDSDSDADSDTDSDADTSSDSDADSDSGADTDQGAGDCMLEQPITVADGAELKTALADAKPCDVIVLLPGLYTTTTESLTVDNELGGTATRHWYFRAAADGTVNRPIRMQSADPQNPAVIQGAGWAAGIDGYGLYITGDHWWVEGIRVANAAKGIMLDNASHVRLIDVEVDDIGQECIHVRDGSSHTLIDGCHVHDCGKRNDGFGEGIYVGSDNSVWKEGDGIVTGEKGLLYSRECHFNTIQNTEVGPNITAEPFDIKEGSTYTLIENCTVYGPGVSGNLFADSFVDIKGCRAIVRNNNFIQGGNSTITRSVMIVSRQNAGVPDAYTARDNYVHDNTFNINPDTYIGFSYTGSENIHMWNNERVPAEGLTYTSRIIQSQPADYTPPE